MRPRWIEIEGLRSFAQLQRIDFSNLRLFAIVGDTGAGKSSILEAIVYALYNGSTWSGRDVKELMNTGAARMRVRFCFSLGDNIYIVSRSTPRAGAASHLFECNERPEERRDGESAVAAQIAALLDVDRETFTKTVLLPQGEFAAFLTLRPTSRVKLLTDLLGLGIIDNMGQVLTAPRERAATVVTSLRAKRSQLPEKPAETLTSAVRSRDAASAGVSELEAALAQVLSCNEKIAAASAAVTAQRAEAEKVARAPAALARLEMLEPLDLRLAALAKAAECERTRWSQTAAGLAVKIEARARAGWNVSALRDAADIMRQLADAAVERRRDGDECARRSAARVAALAARDAAEGMLARVTIDASAKSEAARAASAHLAEANSALTAAESAFDSVSEARAAVAESDSALIQLTTALRRAEDETALATSRYGQTRDRLAQARLQLETTQRVDAAAHAAHGLVPGDVCPVCDRPLPTQFSAPQASGLDQSNRAVAQAEKAAADANARCASATVVQRVAAERLVTTREDHLRREKRFEEALQLLDVAGIDAQHFDRDRALAEARNIAEKAHAATTLAQASSTSAIQQRATLAETRRAATSAVDAAEQALRDWQQRVDVRDATLATLLQRLSQPFQPRPPAGLAEFARLGTEIDRELQKACDEESDRIAASTQVSDWALKISDLRARREREISVPTRAAIAEMHAAVERLQHPAAVDGNHQTTLGETLPWARTVVKAACHAAQELETSVLRELRRRQDEARALAALLERFGVSNEAQLSATRDDAREKLALANYAVEIANQELKAAEVLDIQLGRLEPLSRALDALRGLLGDAKFKNFVAARKQDRLLGVGTTILRRMTNERYGFGPDFSIVDRAATQTRSPDTLSGGEKFLASLALSLALVEIAARSGRRFDALFLDEGFGSLDPRALDEALTELERQAAGGRTIGVITHVNAVMEYIDAVLRVTRGPNGSEVHRVEDDERTELAVGEVTEALFANRAN